LIAGQVHNQKPDFAEAAANYRQAVAILEVEPMRSEDPARLAKAYEALGDSLIATNSEKESVAPTETLREAQRFYQQSLEIWQDLQTRGRLVTPDMEEPEKVSRSLAKCNVALARRDG
jgi:tetratricopeptide (TPR) repeat protein